MATSGTSGRARRLAWRRPAAVLAASCVIAGVVLHQWVAGHVPTPVGPAGAWTSVFHDEFDGDALDLQKWRPNRSDGEAVDGAFNPDLEAAAFAPGNVAVRDGSLALSLTREATVVNGVNYPLRSGTVSTEGRALLKDGDYVEARVLVPRGAGYWPAFWACTPGSWPPEIDGFEFFNTAKQARPSFNYISPDGGKSGPRVYGDSGRDYRGDWHTYGWLRQKGTLTPYLDGVAYPEAGASDVDGADYFLILNLSIYRDSGAEVMSGQSEMRVDWVRAWRRSSMATDSDGS